MKNKYMVFIGILFTFSNVNKATASEIIKWNFTAGGKIYSSPVVRNDTLFIGSADSFFYALDAATGDKLWQYNTNNQILSTAALYGNRVIIESGNILYGLDMGGNLLWTDTLYNGAVINQHEEWDCFRSSPEIVNGIAYIGSEKGLVIGVDAITGARVFEAQTSEANATIETTPAIYNSKIYVGDYLGVFSVFDLNTGDLVWSHDTKEDNVSNYYSILSKPLIYNDTLYFAGRTCLLYAMNPETGEVYWTYHDSKNMWLYGGPVVSDDIIYVGSSYQQSLFAFSSDTAKLIKATDVYGLNYGNPTIHDDYVLIGTGDVSHHTIGSLTIVNKNTGGIEEKLNLGGWVQNTPAFYNGIIYFGCEDGNVYAVNEQNLINQLRPNIFLKDYDVLDLGAHTGSGSIDMVVYVHNDGEAKDSVVVRSVNYATIVPSFFSIEPDDSIKVEISLDLSGLSEGTKRVKVTFVSIYNMLPLTLEKWLVFEINAVTGISDHFNHKPSSVSQNYPNPLNEFTYIEYSVEKECFVQLKVFDLTGRKAIDLVNGVKSPGTHVVSLNASELKGGLYFYEFIAGNVHAIKKMNIAR